MREPVSIFMIPQTEKNGAEKIVAFNWYILLVLLTATIILGITRDGIPALFPFIQQDFALTRAQMGLFSTFFFLSSMLVAVTTGRMVDLLGPRGSMILGASSIGLIMVLFSLARNLAMVLFLAFLMGLGVSFITPAASKGVMEWFPQKNRGVAMGLVQSGIGAGSFLAASTLPFLGEVFHWRTAIVFTGILALILCFFFYRFYLSPGEEKEIKTENDSFGQVLFLLLKNRYFMLLCFLALVFGMAFGSTNSHYTLYLYQDHGLSRVVAGWGFAVLHLGAIVGRIGWGYISDVFLKGDRRQGLLVIGFSITFFSLLLGFFIGEGLSINLLFLLSFLMGFTSLGFFGLYVTAIGEEVGGKTIGTAMGISLTFFRLGLLMSPPLFGLIADRTGRYAGSWVVQGLFVFFAMLFFLHFSSLQERRAP